MMPKVCSGRLLPCVAGALLSVYILLSGVAVSAQDKPMPPSVFNKETKAPAPDFELKDLDDATVKLSQFKGQKPVLVYFWATWCPYCVSMKPDIVELREKVSKDKLEILGVNVGGGDTLARLKKYQEGRPVPWPILYDRDGKATKAYRVQGIPLFVLVDKEGNVVYRGNGLPEDISKHLQ